MKKLFSIDTDGEVTLQDDTLLLIPELKAVLRDKKLGSKAIRWIVLVCDYYSPYRQLLEAEKKKDATQDVYGKEKVPALSSPLIKEACEKYHRLQYDPLIDQYQVYTLKIAQYNTFIREMSVEANTADDLSKLMITVEKINQSREKIKDLIVKKEEESHISGGGEVPFIEQHLQKVS